MGLLPVCYCSLGVGVNRRIISELALTTYAVSRTITLSRTVTAYGKERHMNVSEITFGVEIECYVRAGSVVVGAYHNGIPVPGFPAGWTAMRDSSLGIRRGRDAVEFVSPILKGADGLNQVKAVLAKLRELDASVDRRCGFHVHVGFTGDAVALERLTTLVANHEKAIYAATGTKNRERGAYSASIQRAFTGTQFRQTPNGLEIVGAAADERYRLLNLTNLARRTKPTVEFRAFAGTLNFSKIVAYVRICVGLVERAAKMTRKGKWTAKRPVESSPIARDGEGETEVVRLSYQLGWTKGRQSHTFGDLSGPGLPTMRASKKQLVKMAKQYDAQR